MSVCTFARQQTLPCQTTEYWISCLQLSCDFWQQSHNCWDIQGYWTPGNSIPSADRPFKDSKFQECWPVFKISKIFKSRGLVLHLIWVVVWLYDRDPLHAANRRLQLSIANWILQLLYNESCFLVMLGCKHTEKHWGSGHCGNQTDIQYFGSFTPDFIDEYEYSVCEILAKGKSIHIIPHKYWSHCFSYCMFLVLTVVWVIYVLR